MNLPGGGQWESAIAFLVLGFLIWELRNLRRTQRQDREKAQQAEAKPPE
jgi:cytochrome c-type biogenesis protein CcmH/NrfF